MTTQSEKLVVCDTDGNEHWLICVSAEQIVTERAGIYFIWARLTGHCVSLTVDDLKLTAESMERAHAAAEESRQSGLTVQHGGKPISAKQVVTFELHQLATVVRTLMIDGDMLRSGAHFRNYPDSAGFCRNVVKNHADIILERLSYLRAVALDLMDAPAPAKTLKHLSQKRETKG